MSKEEAVKDQEEPKSSGGYGRFAIKTAIVTVAISLGVVFIVDSVVDTVMSAFATVDTGSLTSRLQNVLREEKTRLRIKGLITKNPAVHYRVSLVQESEGNLPPAIEEMELAIGLLDLHSTDKSAKERYASRLQELKRKLAALPQKPAPR